MYYYYLLVLLISIVIMWFQWNFLPRHEWRQIPLEEENETIPK